MTCLIIYTEFKSTVRPAENQHALPFYGSQKLFISGHKSDTYRYTWLSRWSCFSHLSWTALNGERWLNYIPFEVQIYLRWSSSLIHLESETPDQKRRDTRNKVPQAICQLSESSLRMRGLRPEEVYRG